MSKQTTYLQRFHEALSALCIEEPPEEMCQAWLDDSSEELQQFAMQMGRFGWHQGIALIDAAMLIAESPEEGEPHHLPLTA